MKGYLAGELEIPNTESLKTNLIMRFFCIIVVLSSGMLFPACTEIFKFNTENESSAIIIEGQISDVSSDDYFNEFSERRYFQLKIKEASSVANVRDVPLSAASVELLSDYGESWDYTETEVGVYELFHEDFEALPNIGYKVVVELSDGRVIESELEPLPESMDPGKVSFEEVNKPTYQVVSDETKILDTEGLNVLIELPEKQTNDFRYFRWDFSTTWILRAKLIPPSSPVGRCWLTDEYYLDEYVLLKTGEFSSVRELFFIPTHSNLKIENGFAVRIRQVKMTEGYYQFWYDLKSQEKQADLFAPPPYNTLSNIQFTNGAGEVYGYFGVVREQNYTWYLNLKDLSYAPRFEELCFVVPPFEPAEFCNNCMNKDGIRYGETITNIQPDWWKP